jgi:hypothetical protein
MLSIRFCFLQIDTFARRISALFSASRQRRLVKIRVELFESSPRLAARDGMEQEPYEFRSCPAGIAKAIQLNSGIKG